MPVLLYEVILPELFVVTIMLTLYSHPSVTLYILEHESVDVWVLAFQEVLRPEIFEYPSAVKAIIAISLVVVAVDRLSNASIATNASLMMACSKVVKSLVPEESQMP